MHGACFPATEGFMVQVGNRLKELLGLQLDRPLCARSALCLKARADAARIQGDGRALSRGEARSYSGRPNVIVQGHRQCVLLPPGRGNWILLIDTNIALKSRGSNGVVTAMISAASRLPRVVASRALIPMRCLSASRPRERRERSVPTGIWQRRPVDATCLQGRFSKSRIWGR